MSHASNRRALDRLLRKHRKKHDPWLKAVFAMACEQKAAQALAEVAQILAGTEKIKAARFAASSIGTATEAAPGVDHPSPRSRWPVWSETVRPGPHDVLTWDEVMRVPWHDSNQFVEAMAVEPTPPLPPRPRDWQDPWGAGGFLIPSYATWPDERDDCGEG